MEEIPYLSLSPPTPSDHLLMPPVEQTQLEAPARGRVIQSVEAGLAGLSPGNRLWGDGNNRKHGSWARHQITELKPGTGRWLLGPVREHWVPESA